MATRDVHQNPHVRDEPPTEGDRFARESFTWRSMKRWQIWTAAIAAAAFVIIGLVVL